MRSKGECPPRQPLSRIAWSWLGAFLGIYLIAVISWGTGLDKGDALFLTGAFGATAVLLYGAPLAEFSQPRNLVGGHLVSALVGVTAQTCLGWDPALASAVAVSLSIAVMHYTRTVHPPGGATALIAVIGGPTVHNLGYRYALAPVLANVLVMLLVALVVNNFSVNPKRHYPVYWH